MAGTDEREYLSPIQLGRLLPVIPSVLALLREHNPMAADLFLDGEEVDRKTINYVMSDLLNTLNFNGDLTMMELRFSFASYKIPVWLGLVREVLTGSWPRVVPDRVASELLGSLNALSDAQSPIECAYVLGPCLDRIPRNRYRVLAEFCSFLRDTSSSPEDMACLTGPFLLCPSTTLTTQGTSLIASQTAASAAIMDMLIQESEMLFGRHAVKTPLGYPLGMRPTQTKPDGHRRSLSGQMFKRLSFGKKAAPPPPGRGAPPGLAPKTGRKAPPPPPRAKNGGAPAVSSKTMTLQEKRKLGLRVFYQWRDPRRADRVELLFSNYDFEEIALAIQRKYYMLPPGWKEQLEYMLFTGNRNLGWFARLKQGILPAPVEQDMGHMGGPDSAPQEETKIDKIINEIADTEQKFNKMLSDLMGLYVNKVKSIADGSQGQAAAKALGLTTQQVDHIFGQRLSRVVEVSNSLLSDLEVVTLVRVQPKSGKSRIELVSRVFLENSQQLYVFSPFACAHKTAVTFLRQARESLGEGAQSGGGGALRRLGSLLGSETQKNYLQIWSEISQQSDLLRGQTLESILIMPIQRVPRYRLLLGELQKATPKTDSCYTQLAEVVEIIKGLNTDINEAIRAHERLMKKFGDELTAPQASKTGNKGGVRNVY